jgi:threonyl-tRNA synthetase
VQVMVLNISENQADYVRQVVEKLKKNGLRCEFDLRNEKITYKIREHSMQKMPYLLVAGEREMQTGHVAVRTRKGEDLGSMPIEALIERLKAELETKV